MAGVVHVYNNITMRVRDMKRRRWRVVSHVPSGQVGTLFIPIIVASILARIGGAMNQNWAS